MGIQRKNIKAYQCDKCGRLDVDDATDKRFCTAGFYKNCGDADGCKKSFIPIDGKGQIGVHR